MSSARHAVMCWPGECRELMQGWADMLDDFRAGKTEILLAPRQVVINGS